MHRPHLDVLDGSSRIAPATGWVVLLCALVLGPATGASQSLYRWVDEHGEVHYSDRLPPDAVDEGYREYNQSGQLEGETGRAKTEAERRIERLREERRQKQAKQDRILLKTFTSTEEIREARADRLAAVESSIKVLETLIDDLSQKLTRVSDRIERLREKGRAIPQELKKEQESLWRQIDDNQSFLQRKRKERQAIRNQYQDYLTRFQELKGSR